MKPGGAILPPQFSLKRPAGPQAQLSSSFIFLQMTHPR